jgi:predicted hydrocarbon binding protein
MSVDQERQLSSARVRRFMLAIQDVMGQSGLTTVLRQAGLQRYVGNLPAATHEPSLRAVEYAGLIQAIENYYGRGARGTLTRIGYASFNRLVTSEPLSAALYRLVLRVLPMPGRRRLVLTWLARAMDGPGGQVTVEAVDQRLTLVDRVSDGTAGRTRDAEICWVTLGEIQEALKWGTSREHDVAEVGCRARGEACCRFEVGQPLG